MNDQNGGSVRPDGLVVYPERRIKLSTVAVDSGRLLLADPAYIRNLGGVDDLDDSLIGDRQAIPALDGLGLLFKAGLGDGAYEVHATVGTVPGWGERVKRVEILLIEDDTAQARADRYIDIAVSVLSDADQAPGEEWTLEDELLEQARRAESDHGLIGSALARFCESRGWTRAQLAEWLYVNENSLAALYCEPRPVPIITTGPGGGRGVFTEAGGLLAMAAQYDVGNNESLIEAYRVGIDDVTAVRTELLTLAELRNWEALPIRWSDDVGGSEEAWRSFMATADAAALRTALDAGWDRWVETGLTPAWQAASERWHSQIEGGR